MERGGKQRFGDRLHHHDVICHQLWGDFLIGIENWIFLGMLAERLARFDGQRVLGERADQGDGKRVAHGGVDSSPKKHMGRFGHEFLQPLHQQLDFEEREIFATRKVD